jgi:cytoskeletal protein RodZ
VLTSEELRVAALEASAKRSKTVARRRLIRRWFMWFSWRILFPVIGLIALLAAIVGFASWQYLGHEAAYSASQRWFQEQFGGDNVSTVATRNSDQLPFDNSSQPKPRLKIDRNYSKNVTIQIDNDKEALKEGAKTAKDVKSP